MPIIHSLNPNIIERGQGKFISLECSSIVLPPQNPEKYLAGYNHIFHFCQHKTYGLTKPPTPPQPNLPWPKRNLQLHILVPNVFQPTHNIISIIIASFLSLFILFIYYLFFYLTIKDFTKIKKKKARDTSRENKKSSQKGQKTKATIMKMVTVSKQSFKLHV